MRSGTEEHLCPVAPERSGNRMLVEGDGPISSARSGGFLPRQAGDGDRPVMQMQCGGRLTSPLPLVVQGGLW